MTSCKRNGVNQTVTPSECVGHPLTKTAACTTTVLFSGTWGDRNGEGCGYSSYPQTYTMSMAYPWQGIESMNPRNSYTTCRDQGGMIELTVTDCTYVATDYRQDYDSGGTFRCIRQQ